MDPKLQEIDENDVMEAVIRLLLKKGTEHTNTFNSLEVTFELLSPLVADDVIPTSVAGEAFPFVMQFVEHTINSRMAEMLGPEGPLL
jgi:hypothetical protein